MEFDLNDKGDLGKPLDSWITIPEALSNDYLLIFTWFLVGDFRHDGLKADAGETGTGQDSLGVEEDDVGSGWRSIQRDNQLHGLPRYDAGKKACHFEAVSGTAGQFVLFSFPTDGCHMLTYMWFLWFQNSYVWRHEQGWEETWGTSFSQKLLTITLREFSLIHHQFHLILGIDTGINYYYYFFFIGSDCCLILSWGEKELIACLELKWPFWFGLNESVLWRTWRQTRWACAIVLKHLKRFDEWSVYLHYCHVIFSLLPLMIFLILKYICIYETCLRCS